MVETILHLSDTHGLHNNISILPDADVIIHSGDFSFTGSENEIIEFLEWFIDLQYRHKIFVAGNHDDYLFRANVDGLPDSCHYLCNSGVVIDGVHFYGIPMFVEDNISGEYDKMISKIPNDTDVLITHQPPIGILDKSGGISFGSKEILNVVLSVKPKYHLFGHIHDAAGIEHKGDTTFVNGSIVDELYKIQHTPILLRW